MLQDTSSLMKSNGMCSMLARAHGFDRLIKISERQEHIGPQLTTLKNTFAAIVAAVWQDSKNYNVLVKVMASLGNSIGDFAHKAVEQQILIGYGYVISHSTRICPDFED
ncbi:hypothetical protein LTR95_003385 [Oleoguttula sp. CCFEE 5521]